MNQYFSAQDIKENKVKAGLGYLVFFLPLVLCRESKLGRHCANQGLLLLIVNIISNILLEIFTGIPLLGWVFVIVQKLVSLALVLIGLLCMLNLTTNERASEIPLVGGFRIIS